MQLLLENSDQNIESRDNLTKEVIKKDKFPQINLIHKNK